MHVKETMNLSVWFNTSSILKGFQKYFFPFYRFETKQNISACMGLNRSAYRTKQAL